MNFFVLNKNSKKDKRQIIWASDKRFLVSGQPCIIPKDKLTMTRDGNLVLYTGNNQTLGWQTSTKGKGNYAVLEDDGDSMIKIVKNFGLHWILNLT